MKKKKALTPTQTATRDVMQLTEETREQARKLVLLFPQILKFAAASKDDELLSSVERAVRIEHEIFQRTTITATLVLSLKLKPGLREQIHRYLRALELQATADGLNDRAHNLSTAIQNWRNRP